MTFLYHRARDGIAWFVPIGPLTSRLEIVIQGVTGPKVKPVRNPLVRLFYVLPFIQYCDLILTWPRGLWILSYVLGR